MTTPRPPLQPEINKPSHHQQSDTFLPWYRSGIVWLGIALTVLVIVGCVHLVVVTRAYVHTIDSPTENSSTKELTTFRGMQLHSSPKSDADNGGKAEQ